jgi:hypothetical protein
VHRSSNSSSHSYPLCPHANFATRGITVASRVWDMSLGDSKHRFGVLWLFFGYSLALHVLDEAGHDFLSVYNPNALALRRVLSWLPFPQFTLQSFIGALLLALALWLGLAPLAFRGSIWMRRLAIPVGLLAGCGNGLAHIGSSVYFGRMMPGVYTAPLILLAGILLLRAARRNQD